MENRSELALKELDEKVREVEAIPTVLSVLPLRNIVVVPFAMYPILIGRASSLKAVAKALERGKFILLLTQKDAEEEEPTAESLYRTGTVGKILEVVRLPNDLVKILVEGLVQAQATRLYKTAEGYWEAEVQLNVQEGIDPTDKELQALIRHARDLFHQYVQYHREVPPEVATAFDNIDDPVKKLYYAVANLQVEAEQKQKILEHFNLKDQYFELIAQLTAEIDVLKLEQDIDQRVQETIQKAQRRYLIQEQIRALQQELGEEAEANPELAKLKEAIEAAKMPEVVKARAYEEFQKLKKIPPMAPEFTVVRNYLDWLVSLPWAEATPDNLDIEHVRKILDEDHYGLEMVKERILEYIAVLNLIREVRGQILCFVGPPGVGKTSLAKSIARALGRKFVRISLGGVRDEAEIRGHRRTYVGAMPGKIIQAMKRAGTINPVILLDEVDKMGIDFRGDPAAALLEVLDPEQNYAFNDHYLEVDYDLSKVLFIATANVKFDIPQPLLDRMELIELTSYLDFEKLEIAKRHLIPRLLKAHGLERYRIRFHDAAIMAIIQEYTKEAGVRNLERQLASILRKLAKQIVYEIAQKQQELQLEAQSNGQQPEEKDWHTIAEEEVRRRRISIRKQDVYRLLKAPPFRRRRVLLKPQIGVAMGLAWTSFGGDILPVEVIMMPGKERLLLTGKLGEVMKESAQAALSFVRANAKRLGVPEQFAENTDIHIHVPEGAIPKDGPSAGITIAVALISAAAQKPVRGDVAMTGEITLRGTILPIGGLTEKLVAAKRAKMSTVLLPADNVPDLEKIPDRVKEGLEIVPVRHLFDAMPHVFPKT